MQNNNNNMAEKSDWVEEGTKPSVAPSSVDHNLEIYHPVNILDQIFQKMTGRHLNFLKFLFYEEEVPNNLLFG